LPSRFVGGVAKQRVQVVAVNHSKPIGLSYGEKNWFSCRIDSRRVVAIHSTPRSIRNLTDKLCSVLEHPLDFPPLEQAIVPGDRIVLVLDPQMPGATIVVAETWKILKRQDINPKDVVIIQPVSLNPSKLSEPRSKLPEHIRRDMVWKIHDPTKDHDSIYLASTSSGERIHLAREVVEADFIIPIGSVAFDPVLGYRGTSSVLYPGLSSSKAISRAHGQGHRELGPDDERPLRQLIDEIAGLLGIQFAIQVIAAGGGGVANILAGSPDSVFQRGKQLLAEHWMVHLDTRPEIIVAAVDSDAAGHSWPQIGAALATARNLVAKDGKIIILSSLDEDLTEGLRMIQACQSPRDAIKPLRTRTPPDLIAATQLANAVDWAYVYLLSNLDGNLVEDLFISPIKNEQEVKQLLSHDESCAFLGAAQHTYGLLRSA